MSDSSATERNPWRRRILIALVLLGAGGYFASVVIRDAAMDISQCRIPAGIPDSVLENIKMDRDVNGDLWKADVGRAERGRDWTSLYDIAVEVNRVNGQIWTLNSPSGRYLGKNATAAIDSPEGTVADGDVLFNYKAPLASWEQEAKVIVFPEGFEAWGDQGSFRAGYMTLIPGGVMKAEKGAVLKWFDLGGKNR